MGPFRFLLGARRYGFSLSDAAEVMNICMRHALVYKSLSSREGVLTLEFRLYDARRLEGYLREAGIEPVGYSDRGLPRLIYKYRHRLGLFLGAVFFCLILIFSRLVLWDVRIEGEERLSESEVKEILSQSGMTVGMPLSRLRPEKIETAVLMLSDDISWISVNLFGTVAHVEIREHVYPESDGASGVSNLIAACDGTIVGFEKVRGNVSVAIGDFVRAGELLVGGVYDSDTLGFNVAEASGRVFARVFGSFSVEIPLEYEKKVYTGEEFVEKYLIFYNKDIKFYSNCRNLPPKCDTIDTKEYVSFFGWGELPFGVRTVCHREYEYLTVTRSREEAIDEAFLALRRELDAAGATDVLKKKFTGEMRDDAFFLSCEVEYVKDIAVKVDVPYEEN